MADPTGEAPPEEKRTLTTSASEAELSARLMCGSASSGSLTRKVVPMVSRKKKTLEPRLKSRLGSSKSTPGLFLSAGTTATATATKYAAVQREAYPGVFLGPNHPLSTPNRGSEEQLVEPPTETALVEVVEECTEPARKEESFLESLRLTPTQMASFVEDAGFFLYLNRSSSSATAYDLKVVGHNDVDKGDYWTLSCAGTTRFRGHESEFTPLARWEREFAMFHRMRSIPFFAKYRSWKTFTVWKKNVKRGKIKDARGALKSTLVLLRPSLREALLGVQALCQESLQLGLVEVEPGRTYGLREFERCQADIQAKRAKALVLFAADAQRLARVACDRVVDEFLQAAKIVADHRMTFMERASLRSECRKLTRFLRVVDFHVVATLRDLALDAVRKAKELVDWTSRDPIVYHSKDDVPPDHIDAVAKVTAEFGAVETSAKLGGDAHDDKMCDKKKPLIKIELSYDEHGLAAAPGLQEVAGVFNDLLAGCLKVVGLPDRVFAHPDLAPYVLSDADDPAAERGEETSVADMVSNEDRFAKASAETQAALKDAFQQVFTYGRLFKPFYERSVENSHFRAGVKDAFFEEEQEPVSPQSPSSRGRKKEDPEKGSSVDLAAYARAVSGYRTQVEEFATMPEAADVGVLRVDSGGLKRELLPSPSECLDTLQARLPELLDEGLTELLDELSAVLPVVNAAPTLTEQFIAKRRVVKEAHSNLERYKEGQGKLLAMSNLMNAEDWPMPEDLKAHLVMLDDNVKTLETGVETAEAREADDTEKFARQIADEVPTLKKSIVGIREELDAALIASEESAPATVVSYLEERQEKLGKIRARTTTLADYQQELGLDVDEYDALEEVAQDLNLKLRVWKGIEEWARLTEEWLVTSLTTVDSDQLAASTHYYGKLVHQAVKGLPTNPVVPTLKNSVEKFAPMLPVVVDLRNPALKDRHWTQIHDLVGFSIQGRADVTLGDLVEKGATRHQAAITAIATNATQEAVLEDMMAKVTTIWQTTELIVNEYKEVKDLFVLGDVSDAVALLDESLVTVNTVLGSRYVGGIRAFVEKWRKDLILFQDTLDEWLACQRGWMYLEAIFASPDIVRQLPAAAKQFQNVDKSFRAIMKATAEEPLALKVCCVKDRKELFAQHNATLDKIQKSLDNYVETKCAAFPRFYFLSADELLEILSQSKDPQAVQPHLRKCFDNLVKLKFADDVAIVGMFSGEGELVGLGKNLKARGGVEDWLSAVEARMKLSLHGAMKLGLQDYDRRPRPEWVLDHPGQVVATVAQMMWARGSENALRANDPNVMKDWYQTNLTDLLGLIEKIRSDLPKLQRKKIVALVTTDVHARDIVEDLVHKNVQSTTDFTWMQQLRYYWERVDENGDEDCLIHHSDAVIHYGYEYMGCTSRLVITPLTDRCWLTLTGSYGLKLGAAPAGPAGTGKTESSKDLAKAMAIQCVVFNCSDQIDYMMMGKLFRGLAQSSSWVCLDEFNRIDIEVLSVIAQQLLVLREGRIAKKAHIDFMGVEIKLLDHHVIITMNPGYAGRTELPDNLQVCFRPVAMMVPNYALIAEIMLFAEGFGDAKTLSRKMCKLYILCSEQLSQQPHYDYGLRAVKSVLVMAGSLKRGNPDTDEDLVLIRALRDSNLPKFLSFDIPLFFAIIQDLFPGVQVPSNDYGEFQVAMEEEITKAGLQNVHGFHTKIIQLFDIFNIRFGATLVGPTGSGKSTCYRVLAATMTSLFRKGSNNPQFQDVEYQVLNPKAISMGELYGEVNSLTQEWRDGLGSTIMRRAVAANDDTRRWTVFDGPVDAIWIENMNTVLDDNMTLCLANGERIKLRAEMKMLFEVQDLAQASPATVSRIGVVFVSPTDLGWMPYVHSWAQALPEKVTSKAREHIVHLFETLFTPALAFQRKKLSEPVKTNDVQLATSCTLIFQSLFLPLDLTAYEQKEDDLLRLIEKLFYFSLTWSVGGSVSSEGFEPFDLYAKEAVESSDVDLCLPSDGSSYDYFVDTSGRGAIGTFTPWKSIVPEFSFDKDLPYTQIVVSTEDTTRFGFLMKQLIQENKPFFLTGVTGTGKTVMIQDTLKSLSPLLEDGGAGVVPLFVNFSAQTASLVVQQTIESKLEKKRKNLLGAPAGRKVVCFVDDVNMPIVETYGAQPPIELLRQFLDFKGFYDRDKLFWKDIADVMLVTAAAPPGGGRSEVTPRFVRHFNVFCVPPASESAMTLIFHAIFDGFLTTCGFDKSLQALTQGVVAGTIEVYNTIAKELLPTPTKFVYQFNLRDLSKVFQGMLMVTAQKAKDAETLSKLWLHEAQRVFYDRLINTTDQAWFEKLACDILQRHLQQPSASEDDLFGDKAVIFADFTKAGVDVESRKYEHVAIDSVTKILTDVLDEYNVSFPTRMNLVFFSDAVRHVCRMCRILRQPRGNAMLVGVGGSGKQSTAKLAAFVSEMDFCQIEITRGYGLREFREDVKRFMISTGVEGKDIVFCFTDSQVVDESMLEDLNSVLNSGEIPNLFPMDELDKICSDMIPVCDKLQVAASRDNCIATFVQRVWDKMHIVLCMSPVGDALRIRCRQFPSLINCTTIDYFLGWPESALHAVASHFLSSVKLGSGSDALEEKHRGAIVSLCVKVHTSIEETADDFFAKLRRRTYTTPKSYLDLINMYSAKLGQLQAQVDVKIDQMTIGCQKLAETNAIVEGLREELKKLEPVLAEKKAAAEVMLKQVAVDQADAEVQKEKVSTEEAELNKKSQEVAAVAADAQADLDVAMPALNAAVKALDSLTKNDIVEVKAFKSPPLAVKVTMEGICIMLERKPDWDEAKKVLSDTNFLDKLKSYDKDNIKESVIKKIAKYITEPNMQIEVVTKVSQAAKGLCMWIHAMNVYHKVAKEVAPKKAKVDEMNRQLAEANASLKEKQDILQAVLDKVQKLQDQCDATVAEKQELEQAQEQTAQRLTNAEKLTSGLSSEGVRWKENLELYAIQRVTLIGDTILASAAISYYGPFTGVYRDALWQSWIDSARQSQLPCAETPTLLDTLGDPVKVREWRTQLLPTDDVSTNNAILVTQGRRYPLCIDPQMQAHRWIRKMAEKSGLMTTTMRDGNLLRVLEQAIRNGKPLLIEDVGETIEPALDPILQKATFKQGNRLLIRLGDQSVDFDPEFTLFMTTKLSNPHYLPEVCIKVTIINFSITAPGLEDQLLGNVVKSERPEVEKKSTQLLVQMAADRRKLADIEADILRRLSESKGNILDDSDLINALAESQMFSKMIKERLETAEVTREEITAAREQYRSVATRGSILYFTIADMAEIDPMYQYSLQYYQSLFVKCLADARAEDDLDRRIAVLIEYSTQTVYANICRGLFEAHKVLFSALLAFSVLREARAISPLEWSLLIRGVPVADRAGQPKNPGNKFSEQAWDLLCALDNATFDDDEQHKVFSGLTESVTNEWSRWEPWMSSSNPSKDSLPAPFDQITSFQNLLLVKALRDDKALLAINTFVREKFGDKLGESPAASMDEVYGDLDNATPCIFILSKGSDPSSMLFKLAKSRGFSDQLDLVSLGQGQGPAARALVERGTSRGRWVALQNCMLAKSWMPDLEAMVFELQEHKEKNHPDFRLFLTSSPATYFPVSVLQNGVKMTNEAPKGIRANMIRSYTNLVKQEDFESNAKPEAYKRLLSALCFFHANILERRKFGPLGWNIRYAFDESDLETSMAILRRFLNEQDHIPWDALRFVTGHINYGGRVTDDFDRRTLLCVLGIYFNETVMSKVAFSGDTSSSEEEKFEDYAFSASGIYKPAGTGELVEEHLEYFKSLPAVDEPEIFGMHENADITFNRAESSALVTQILQLQPRETSSGGAGKSSDEIVLDLIADIQSKTPALLDDDEAGEKTFVVQENGLLTSLDTVLKQEMVKFNRLTLKMRASLVELHKAINGLVVMSSDLDQMYTAFLNNTLPRIWANVSFATLKSLGSWVKDVVFRVDFMRTWLVNGLPACFPLPVFFFPQGFMTGTLQTYARKYQVAIDTLQFNYDVLAADLPTVGPEDGIYISGLWLEGARWDFDRRHVCESRLGEMFVSMPVMHLTPAVNHVIPDGWYACPVYKTAERKGVLSTTGMSTNFVVAIELPSSTDPNRWILAGAACLCNLTD